MQIETLREMIVQQMKKNGETYQSLGEKIGVNRCNVFTSIKRRDFRYDTLKKICDALNIEMKFTPKKR